MYTGEDFLASEGELTPEISLLPHAHLSLRPTSYRMWISELARSVSTGDKGQRVVCFGQAASARRKLWKLLERKGWRREDNEDVCVALADLESWPDWEKIEPSLSVFLPAANAETDGVAIDASLNAKIEEEFGLRADAAFATQILAYASGSSSKPHLDCNPGSLAGAPIDRYFTVLVSLGREGGKRTGGGGGEK